jgi:hypothetical protein
MRKFVLLLLLLSSLPAVAQSVLAIPPQQCVWSGMRAVQLRSL